MNDNGPFLEDFEKNKKEIPEAETIAEVPTGDAEADEVENTPTPSLHMTKAELTAIAEDRGIEVSDAMTKAEILEAIEG